MFKRPLVNSNYLAVPGKFGFCGKKKEAVLFRI
jgi:hypothetical protein